MLTACLLKSELFVPVNTVCIMYCDCAVKNVQPFMVLLMVGDDQALRNSLHMFLYCIRMKNKWNSSTVPFYFNNQWWLMKSFSLNKLSKERAHFLATLLSAMDAKEFGHCDFWRNRTPMNMQHVGVMTWALLCDLW